MARELIAIDVTGIPELLKIAEEVGASGDAVLLRGDNEDLAVLMPLQRGKRYARRAKSKKDLDAFRSAAGSWKNVDIDKLLEDNGASRRASTRPPVDL